MRQLSYNPQKDNALRLDNLTCGEDRLALLDQLLRSLEAEKDKRTHQHHLIIGPRGSGKTHLLRVLTGSRIAERPSLSNVYFPVTLPEEIAVRSASDLLLKIVEFVQKRLDLEKPEDQPEGHRQAAVKCLEIMGSARPRRDPLERLAIAGDGLKQVADYLNKILLVLPENLDSLFYLGPGGGRKRRLDAHWAIRSKLQRSQHMLIIATAPTLFGSVGDPEAPFFDFFRIHTLDELSNDDVLDILRRRAEEEVKIPGDDPIRKKRVKSLHHNFTNRSPGLRGMLAITGGLPRFAHCLYDVIVETDISKSVDVLNGFLDKMTPYFQQRLDPRFIPEPEIDLLHELASAQGPLQPSEIADRLYGTHLNEVAELLDRLRKRGFVKRAGRPGGRAVTWDLTEPLYRVWVRFRSGTDERDQLLILAEFIAIMFGRKALLAESAALLKQIQLMNNIDDPQHHSLRSRNEVVSMAMEIDRKQIYKVFTMAKAEDKTTAIKIPSELDEQAARSQATKASKLFSSFKKAMQDGDLERRDNLLDELRELSEKHIDDGEVRESLAMGLLNTLNHAKDEEDLERRDNLLDELRELSEKHIDDGEVRKRLAMGLFNTLNHAKDEEDRERRDNLLDELRELSEKHIDDGEVRKQLAMGLLNTLIDAKDEEDLPLRDQHIHELENLGARHPDDPLVYESLGKAILFHSDTQDQNQAIVNLETAEKLYALSNEPDGPTRGAVCGALVGISRGHMQEAVDRLKKAFQTDPKFLSPESIHKIAVIIGTLLFRAKQETVLKQVQELLVGVNDMSVTMEGYQMISKQIFQISGLVLLNEARKADRSKTGGSRWNDILARVSLELQEFLKPLTLAIAATENQKEKVLAREPEEIRRAVNLILDQTHPDRTVGIPL